MMKYNEIPIEEMSDYLKYDPSVPSGLVWKKSRSNIKAGDMTGTLMKRGYYRIRFNGGLYLSHRVIWSLFNGPIPEGMEIDHIDRNTNNNSIENLRCVERTLNIRNRGKLRNNTSGKNGINFHIHSKSWTVRWYDEDGVRQYKSFSVKKYGGKEEAFEAASKYLDSVFAELRMNGSGHTETYGK